MHFLGNLGIDWKLLIAQIINFGLLLYLLTRFLYKPIISRIEKDEKELAKAKKADEFVEKKKAEFAKKRKQMRLENKKQGQEIIVEAEKVAKKIAAQASKEAEAAKKQYLDQAKHQALSKKRSLAAKMQAEIENSVKKTLAKEFSSTLDKQTRQSLNNLFFKQMIRQLRAYNLSNLGLQPGKKIEQGTITIECASDLSPENEEEIKKVIAKKVKMDKEAINISKHKKKDLIAGCKLEILGAVFDNTFLNLIDNA